MKDKLDLIIDALEKYIAFTPSFYDLGKEALDAARELKVINAELLEALKALIDMDVAYQRGDKVAQAVESARAAIVKAGVTK